MARGWIIIRMCIESLNRHRMNCQASIGIKMESGYGAHQLKVLIPSSKSTKNVKMREIELKWSARAP